MCLHRRDVWERNRPVYIQRLRLRARLSRFLKSSPRKTEELAALGAGATRKKGARQSSCSPARMARHGSRQCDPAKPRPASALCCSEVKPFFSPQSDGAVLELCIQASSSEQNKISQQRLPEGRRHACFLPVNCSRDTEKTSATHTCWCRSGQPRKWGRRGMWQQQHHGCTNKGKAHPAALPLPQAVVDMGSA